MASIGRALMGGLAQGFGAFANMKYNEKQKAEQAERDQELAKLTQQLKEETARFEASLKPAQYQTIEDTGEDGKTVKRTIRSSYDPETQGFVETEVGSAIVPPKQERAESDAEFFARDPKAFAEYNASKRRPLVGGSTKPPEDPKTTSLPQADVAANFGVTNEYGEVTIDNDAYKAFMADKALKAKSDPRYNDAQYALQNWQGKLGYDPNETPPGAIDVNKALMGSLDEEDSARPAGPSAAPPSPAAPPAVGKKPEKAPYPEGTKLKGADGKTYIVKDGVPVPYGS